ncbi:hypothetical protein, partial [Ureibacillus thermosphaericus]|uniref:hypothetical protein n=1 Tax=Ureibacillus thermosphaericus TaxID=51173 RepID=UPI0030C98BA3
HVETSQGRNVGYLGLGRPEVTLRETKGGFRRGTEKLPLQAKLSGSSSLQRVDQQTTEIQNSTAAIEQVSASIGEVARASSQISEKTTDSVSNVIDGKNTIEKAL